MRAHRDDASEYPVLYQSVRRALVRRFSFAIYFIVEESQVFILAVQHQRRDPATRPLLGPVAAVGRIADSGLEPREDRRRVVEREHRRRGREPQRF